MYTIIQSFKPGKISPNDANRLSFELAMRFIKGQHQFVMSPHTDKAYIHTHIKFNSINLDCNVKFWNVKNSAFVLHWINDELCQKGGQLLKTLQVGEWADIQYGMSGNR